MRALFVVIMLATLALAQPTQWFNAAIVSVDLNVSSSITLEQTGAAPFVQELTSDVLFVPRSGDFSAVRSFETYPSAKVTADKVRYEWRSPSIGTLEYGYSSAVDLVNEVPRVRAQIPFPSPVSIEEFLESTKNIDANNPLVKSKAQEIVAGESDMFVAVTKLAQWVKDNVEYNLSTLTAEVSQPASWVLENRYGVCDEITSLFIAMVRSQGIPAKFVSGLAYTNNPAFEGGWGAHGWAEVYFPGVGWVPFDVTFGEFGWVDPGHLKLKESVDPQEPTTVFGWKARDVRVRVSDLELSAGVRDTQGRVQSDIALTVSPIASSVGFGSYVGVMGEITNRADYYVAPEVVLTQVDGVEFVDGNARSVAIPPGHVGRVFWTLRVAQLDPKFNYDIPLIVYTVRNETVESSVSASKWEPVVSKEEVESRRDAWLSKPSDEFALACAFESDRVRTQNAKLNCKITNNEQKPIDVDVCFSACEKRTVDRELTMSFDVPTREAGPHKAEVTVKGAITKRAVLTAWRLDEPKAVLADVVVPENVRYGDSFKIAFMVKRESVSHPMNLMVKLSGGGARADVDIGELAVDQDVAVTVESAQLLKSNPVFRIEATYSDETGKEFVVQKAVPVAIVGVPWWKQIFGFFVR